MNIVGISGVAGSGKDTVAGYLVERGFVPIALADGMKRICKEVFDFSDEQLWGPSPYRNAPDERYPRPHSGVPGGQCACCGSREYGEGAYSDHRVQCYLTPRYALQLLGTEYGRHCYPNVWVDYTMRIAQQVLDNPFVRYTQREGLHVLSMGETLNEKLLAEVPPPAVTGVVITDVRFKNEMQAIRQQGGQLWRVKRPGAGLDGSASLHPSEAEQMSIPDSWFDAVIDNSGTLDDLRVTVQALCA